MFVTYSLCFMSLLVVAGILFQSVGLTSGRAPLADPALSHLSPVKGAYGLNRWGALWRTTLLTIFALVVVFLFAAVIVGLEFFD